MDDSSRWGFSGRQLSWTCDCAYCCTSGQFTATRSGGGRGLRSVPWVTRCGGEWILTSFIFRGMKFIVLRRSHNYRSAGVPKQIVLMAKYHAKGIGDCAPLPLRNNRIECVSSRSRRMGNVLLLNRNRRMNSDDCNECLLYHSLLSTDCSVKVSNYARIRLKGPEPRCP